MNAPEQHTPAGREPLDVRLARIEERVGSIQQHGATKADIKGLEARIGWWLLGVSVLVVAGLVVQVVG